MSSRKAQAAKPSNGRVRTVLAITVFLLGLTVSLYPYIAQHINNISATKLVQSFNDAVASVADGTGEAAGESDVPVFTYDADMFGSIFIPKLELELPIYIGATQENLAKGISHVENTSLPTGGESTHAVLAGHSGAITNEWFTRIDQLVVGDLFYIRSGSTVLTYKVISTKIIDPEDTYEMLIERGRDLVSLISCTPDASQRVFVTGERVLE